MSMSVRSGERLGVVGENGPGKSTPPRLLARVERPDDVEATPPDDVGYLKRTLDLPVQQAVVAAARAGLRTVERRIRDLESALTDDVMAKYGRLLTAYKQRDGYEPDAWVDGAFHGLGLSPRGPRPATVHPLGREASPPEPACALAATPRVPPSGTIRATAGLRLGRRAESAAARRADRPPVAAPGRGARTGTRRLPRRARRGVA
ncbi:ATP-binding cassette domain-containing protein [Nonomuraea sp. NPDC005650]|uniref:ATP-binding cassette domain-containing protein n=1 Tax=Nonomuraea sp. NPDC005650 TaxID=3157045 RepID=UPI0033BAFDAD